MTKYQFEFTGKASEYFGIWIVNLLLSIVTLGIYTAWAKVRRLRYFYGNTHLDGHNFEYHAKPKSILIGRLIVVGILIAINVIATFIPIAVVIVLPIYLFGLPWIINQAMRFNARVTSYRNVRFNFAGTYWGAMKNFIVLPSILFFGVGMVGFGLVFFFKGLPAIQGLVMSLTFIGLLLVFPYLSKLISDYIGQNLSYGTAEFYTNINIRGLFNNLGVTAIFATVTIIVLGLVGALFGNLIDISVLVEKMKLGAGTPQFDPHVMASIFAATIAGYIAIIISALFYRAGVRNLAYNATTLDGKHKLQSSLPRLKYIWVLVSNLIVTLLSLGLLRPWAAIRSWRLLSDNTALLAASDLNEFAGDSTPENAAAGAEYLDIEGVDFGF